MIWSKSIFKIGLSVLAVSIAFCDISAQAVVTKKAPLSGDSLNAVTVKKHALYGGTGYGSNMVYLGSTISQSRPYGYASLSYGFNNELYLSFTSVHLSGVDPFISFNIGSLNYSKVFNSWFDLSAGIYRYQVPQSLIDTLFSNFTYGDITFGLDWRILYSKLSFGALFSDENQGYFQLRNSRYFKTPDFGKGNMNISFDPYVNLLFGTLLEYNTDNETMVTMTTPSRKWGMNNTATSSTSYYSKKFGLMEMDFGIPVALNTNRLTFEVEPDYVLPFYDDPDYPASKGFIIMLSLFFRIL
jgi:hypothetical protein